MGVAFYPALSDATFTDPGSGNPSNFCTPASAIDVGLPSSDDDSALRDGASAVDFAIQRVGATASPLAGGVGGGTPTGDSIAFVAQHAGFGPTIQRQSFLLLMTDGLPNCNPASGLDANVNPAACDCTDGATSTVCTYYPVLDCNDFNETARKVSDIRSTGVKTIVIGYGDVFGTSAQRSLQQNRPRRGLPASVRDGRRRVRSVRHQLLPGDQPEPVLRAVLPGDLEGAALGGSGGGQLGDPPGQSLPGGARPGAGGSDVPHHPGDREGRDDLVPLPVGHLDLRCAAGRDRDADLQRPAVLEDAVGERGHHLRNPLGPPALDRSDVGVDQRRLKN